MARLSRFLKNGACYYIRSQSHQDQNIFKSDLDYEKYLRLLKKYKHRFPAHIYGYCLLPTVVYLIIHPADVGQLPLFMQGMNQSYAMYFNISYARAGKVWGQRYKSVLILNDDDLIECIKSIEFMPVKTKQVISPMEYRWSSCANRILGSGNIIDTMPPGEAEILK